MNGKKAKQLRREKAALWAFENKMILLKYNKGYWDNGKPAYFKVFEVKITHVNEPAVHWQNAFVGMVRQIIEVIFNGSEFFIDNNTGQGLFKLTKGMGNDKYGYSTVDSFEHIRFVPDEKEWQKPDKKKHFSDADTIKAWRHMHFPEQFPLSQTEAE